MSISLNRLQQLKYTIAGGNKCSIYASI